MSAIHEMEQREIQTLNFKLLLKGLKEEKQEFWKTYTFPSILTS